MPSIQPIRGNFNDSGELIGLQMADKIPPSLHGLGLVLGRSAVAVNLTGTLALTTLASVVLPGGMMGKNGGLVIEALWSRVASAQSILTFLWAQGTSTVLPAGAIIAGRQEQSFWARNSEQVQVTHHPALGFGGGGGGSPNVVAAINTTIDQTINIQGQLSNVTDSLTLEAWRVIVYAS